MQLFGHGLKSSHIHREDLAVWNGKERRPSAASGGVPEDFLRACVLVLGGLCAARHRPQSCWATASSSPVSRTSWRGPPFDALSSARTIEPPVELTFVHPLVRASIPNSLSGGFRVGCDDLVYSCRGGGRGRITLAAGLRLRRYGTIRAEDHPWPVRLRPTKNRQAVGSPREICHDFRLGTSHQWASST